MKGFAGLLLAFVPIETDGWIDKKREPETYSRSREAKPRIRARHHLSARTDSKS